LQQSHYFWIINKQHKAIYGPLDKYEYIKKREELKVPNTLSLQTEKAD